MLLLECIDRIFSSLEKLYFSRIKWNIVGNSLVEFLATGNKSEFSWLARVGWFFRFEEYSRNGRVIDLEFFESYDLGEIRGKKNVKSFSHHWFHGFVSKLRA